MNYRSRSFFGLRILGGLYPPAPNSGYGDCPVAQSFTGNSLHFREIIIRQPLFASCQISERRACVAWNEKKSERKENQRKTYGGSSAVNFRSICISYKFSVSRKSWQLNRLLFRYAEVDD